MKFVRMFKKNSSKKSLVSNVENVVENVVNKLAIDQQTLEDLKTMLAQAKFDNEQKDLEIARQAAEILQLKDENLKLKSMAKIVSDSVQTQPSASLASFEQFASSQEELERKLEVANKKILGYEGIISELLSLQKRRENYIQDLKKASEKTQDETDILNQKLNAQKVSILILQHWVNHYYNRIDVDKEIRKNNTLFSEKRALQTQLRAQELRFQAFQASCNCNIDIVAKCSDI